MNIRLNCYPGGKSKALTMSYDDGSIHDRRLVEIFNQYGIRGTFHLNAGLFSDGWRIDEKEVAALYKGHEISVHSFTHPQLIHLPNEVLCRELLEDRRKLEQLAGYMVRGMSYPYGRFDDRVVEAAKTMGMEYARTVKTSRDFELPRDFMRWSSTCHHNHRLLRHGKKLVENDTHGSLAHLFVWGHSYEFENDDNWDMIEEFCKMTGNRDDIWYATCIEMVDYLKALHSMKFSVDGKLAYNPSALTVWIRVNDSVVQVAGGETVSL